MPACLGVFLSFAAPAAVRQTPAAPTKTTANTQAQAPSTPTSTPAPPPAPVAAAAADPAPGAPPTTVTTPDPAAQATYKLFIPDGQLRSHKLRVGINANVLKEYKPRLTLFRSHVGTKPDAGEEVPLEPVDILSNQSYTEIIDGHEYPRTGTILLFNLRDEPFGIRPIVRVLPTLHWTEGTVSRTAATEREINIGDILAIVVWTLAAVAVGLTIIIGLAWRRESNPMLFLTGVEGRLSLAQVQIACWTIVVGGVVFGYGVLRLQIPDIPTSLLALMGASLATGGIAYFKDAQKDAQSQQTPVLRTDASGAGRRVNAGAVPASRTWAWGDLVRTFETGKPPELSLSKAQMLFWTMLLLSLFISKSILEGAIWAVPWPLVALMGFSQAGYLAPKIAGTPPPTAAP